MKAERQPKTPVARRPRIVDGLRHATRVLPSEPALSSFRVAAINSRVEVCPLH